ncbi:MAG: hypothetical protein FJ265_08890 [Planctomycetes bacterium]|nr:hypothetical protein [Planctomycetota bacterium]
MAVRAPVVLLLAAILPAQNTPPTAAGLMRYVDWSRDLDRPAVAVVVGTLGKWKEGRRERLDEGQLGGGAAVSHVSGTQYFKVPVTAAVAVRAVLFPKMEKAQLAFHVQLARLPDGKEQRQSLTGNGARLGEDRLALFVLVPKPKGKDYELLHVIPFDPKVDSGPEGELQFLDTMRDYAAVNLRVRDLRAAIAAVDLAKEPARAEKALGALRELLAQKVELKQSSNDGLLGQHVRPLEQRAQQRLDEAAKEAKRTAKDRDG